MEINKLEKRRLEHTLENLNLASSRQQRLLESQISALTKTQFAGAPSYKRPPSALCSVDQPLEVPSVCFQPKEKSLYGTSHGTETITLPVITPNRPTPCHQKLPQRSIFPECKYTLGPRCPYFPCGYRPTFKSHTNTNISLGGEESVDFARAETVTKSADRCGTLTSVVDQENLLFQIEAASVRRPLLSVQGQINARHRSLHATSSDLDERMRNRKPPDWSVNYGKTFSARKHVKAARP